MINESIYLLGVKVDKITFDEARKKIEKFLFSSGQHYIVTPNPEILMAAQSDDEFRKILNESDLSVPDGIGLLWAATIKQQIAKMAHPTKFKVWVWALFDGLALLLYPKFCQRILPERVTGVDLIFPIAELCEQKNCSIYLIGGKNGVAMAAALKLKQQYPKLQIVGAEEGIVFESEVTKKVKKIKKQNKEHEKNIFNREDNKKLLLRINKAKPNILLVAFGQIKQEKWIYYNLNKIPSVKIAIGVGGAFDFIAGIARRAPFLFQMLGLEWFWRLIWQPWRWQRILTATYRFMKTVIDSEIEKFSH